MKVAIMQPYFFPYLGYFQLINSVELFIVYDNIKYTKKGWVNRNRFLQNGKDVFFVLPLKGDSDFLYVRERELAADFKRNKFLNKIKSAYQHAPYFKKVFPLIELIISYEEVNLFLFLHNSIVKTCEYIGIETEIRVSSQIAIDHGLKGQDKVLALCEAVGANVYVNAIGGMELYLRENFLSRGIELKFIKSMPFEYKQFGNEFVPWLSIVDVMMFNSIEAIERCLNSNYELI